MCGSSDLDTVFLISPVHCAQEPATRKTPDLASLQSRIRDPGFLLQMYDAMTQEVNLREDMRDDAALCINVFLFLQIN